MSCKTITGCVADALLLTLMVALPVSIAEATGGPPNIVLILADDKCDARPC